MVCVLYPLLDYKLLKGWALSERPIVSSSNIWDGYHRFARFHNTDVINLSNVLNSMKVYAGKGFIFLQTLHSKILYRTSFNLPLVTYLSPVTFWSFSIIKQSHLGKQPQLAYWY